MCNYNFEIPVDPIALLYMVKGLIEENGGTVIGEIPDVSISIPTPVGPVAGTCKLVTGSLVNMQVTKKPDFMTCSMVRDKLVFYISEAVKLYVKQPASVRNLA